MKHIISLLFFPVFLIGSFTNSVSQNILLQSYSVENGLPSPNVNCIYQDHNAYLWIGTSNGIAKYNGSSFELIDQRNGLAEQNITAIYEDQYNNIWIGHLNGALSKISNSEISVINLNDGADYSKITNIQEDSIGNIWFSTLENGLFFFNAQKKDTIITRFSPSVEPKISNFINDFEFTENQNLICATRDGLFYISKIYDENNTGIVRLTGDNSNLKNNSISSIAKKSGNEFIIGTKKGLYSYKTANNTDLIPLFKNEGKTILNNSILIIDNEGIIWGNNGYEVFSYDGLKYKHIRTLNINSNNPLNTIFSDNENNIWFGTNNGLYKYCNKEFTFFERETLKNIEINSLLIESNNLWLGTDGGIIKYKIENHILSNEKPAKFLDKHNISFLYHDSRQNIWITVKNETNVYRYDLRGKKMNTFTKNDGFYFYNCNSIVEDEKQNIWFTSANDTGIIFYNYPKTKRTRNKKINKGTFKYKIDNIDFPADSYSYTYKDKSDRIWLVAYNSGLMLWNGNEIKYFEKNNEISKHNVSAIYHDYQDNIWIATLKNGIYKYNGVFFKNISLNKGLITKQVFSLITDNYDNVWITTNCGLHKYDQYAETFINFLGKEKFNYSYNSSMALYSDGFIWLTGNDLITQINPDLSLRNDEPPSTIIENVLIFNKSFNLLDYSESINSANGLPENLKLPFEINHLSFEFAGIKYHTQNIIKYQYKLENLNDEWQNANNQSIQFTNLLPGKYTFKVRSSDHVDIWSKPAILKFRIKAPVYRQIWFYIIIVLAFSLLIYVIILLRVRFFKRVNIKLKENYADRTKQLSSAYTNIESNIKYAKNIQNAILRNEFDLSKIFPQSFVYSKPKESIGGDFFWFSRKSRKIFIAVGDCIGHGVQGAFTSLIGHNLLNQTINEIDSFDPPFILEEISRNFNRAIKNTQLVVEENNDMDIAFCRIDRDRNEIVFSGANSEVYFIHENKLTELKGNRRAIGQDNEVITHFSRIKIKYVSGDVIYMFTNGFADQFGGPENKRFRTTRLKNLLVNIHDLAIEEQKKQITEAFKNWKGKTEQIDDVLILGIRL